MTEICGRGPVQPAATINSFSGFPRLPCAIRCKESGERSGYQPSAILLQIPLYSYLRAACPGGGRACGETELGARRGDGAPRVGSCAFRHSFIRRGQLTSMSSSPGLECPARVLRTTLLRFMPSGAIPTGGQEEGLPYAFGELIIADPIPHLAGIGLAAGRAAPPAGRSGAAPTSGVVRDGG